MNLHLLLPEICLAVTVAVVILIDLFCSRKWLVTTTSVVGLLISAGLALVLRVGYMGNAQTIGNGLFMLDNYACYFKFLLLGITLLVILASTGYVERLPKLHGEFHALLLTATLGAMLTAAAENILSLILSIELTAVSLYALVAMLKNSKSSESAVKYLLLGAVNSAVLLFGLALVFGFSGSVSFYGIAQSIMSIQAWNLMDYAGLLFGLVLVLAGFAFKIAAVPFHMWAPDVYEGAPTPVTLFLSTVSKIAGFSILLRFILVFRYTYLEQNVALILAVVSTITITTGNLLAIAQHNIKRMLAYSSVAQSGYMLIVFAVCMKYSGAPLISSLLYYITAFALAEVAVFTVVIIASRQSDSDAITDYAGLGRRSPALAITMTLGLLSLMGMPALAGFMGKFFVFSHAAQHGFIWLVIVAVANSVISAYYYLRVIRVIWTDSPESASQIAINTSLTHKTVLLITCVGILLLGVLPALLGVATDWGARMWFWG